jgi:hypothetical protein
MHATGIFSRRGFQPENVSYKITFKPFKIIFTERPRGFTSRSEKYFKIILASVLPSYFNVDYFPKVQGTDA